MERIRVKNFRCFREEQTARMAPLTLLVGENSTGKTSFLALIRALWEVASLSRTPDFKEDPYDLGSFDEIAHNRGGRGGRAETFDIAIDFTLEDEGIEMIDTFRFEVTFGKKGTVPVPVRRQLSGINNVCWIEYDLQANPTPQFRFGTTRGAWAWEVQEGIESRIDNYNEVLLSFDFIVSHLMEKKKRSPSKLTILKGTEQPNSDDWELIQWFDEIRPPLFDQPYWPYEWPYTSAPVRSRPRRTYDPSRLTRDPEGDHIPMYLASMHFQNKEGWKTLKSALEKFGKEAGLFNEISVKPLGQKESGPFQVQIRGFGEAKKKGLQRNLIDVGYGVSQVLPVITELLRQDAPQMFLLQQPEVHLHPSAQAALGSLFCQVAGPERQLVVETHSDHLIDRVRMDVRDGKTKLKPEDVSILYFERNDLDVCIHSLRFDDNGNVLDAPDGYRKFFLEETRRSLGL